MSCNLPRQVLSTGGATLEKEKEVAPSQASQLRWSVGSAMLCMCGHRGGGAGGRRVYATPLRDARRSGVEERLCASRRDSHSRETPTKGLAVLLFGTAVARYCFSQAICQVPHGQALSRTPLHSRAAPNLTTCAFFVSGGRCSRCCVPVRTPGVMRLGFVFPSSLAEVG